MATPALSSRLGTLLASAFLVTVLGSPASADVTLSTSQPSYEVGEVVSFALANDTKWIIHLDWWPGWVITDSLTTRVAPCGIIPTVIDIYPGGRETSQWDQRNCWDGSEAQVSPGRYCLHFGYRSECCPYETFSLQAWFTIGLVPVEASTWGQIKARYRE